VAQTGEPLLVADVGMDRRYIDAGNQARSEGAVPLVIKKRVIGVLDVARRTPASLTAGHIELLMSVAGPLATAIESARLFENSREQARSLSLLHQVGREINSILDERELLARVGLATRRLMGYDLFNVMLWDEAQELLVPALSMDRDGRDPGRMSKMGLGDGVLGTVAALRQPMRIPNVRIDPRFVECVSEYDISSELAVPMVMEDRLIGVINVESAQYDAFSAHHEQLLATLGANVAIALENARLYAQVKDDEQRFQQELDMAREIQNQLLPSSTPWVQGLQIGFAYRPARQIGGDFYDFYAIDESRIGIAVGDVAGKATPAALYGSLAIGTLREVTGQRIDSPDQILGHLNDKLHALGIENRFLAMAFLLFDRRSSELRISSSGLPYPYLVRKGEVEVIPVRGVPLGLLPGRCYETLDYVLEPGDVIVVATDGMEESLDGEDREMGREAIEKVLRCLPDQTSADAIAEALTEAAIRHAGSREPSDDQTVVVLKFQGLEP
jgi:sigma-B regulation protein RsbU (phosphoserine phosphatase)